MNCPDRLQQLESQLRSPALNQRIVALDELAQISSDQAVPIFQRLMEEGDVGLRRLAVMGLGNHRSDASLAILKQLLENEPDSNIQSEAANSIFEFGAIAIPLLEQLFVRSDNWLVKQTIISLLNEADDSAALHRVITLALQDPIQTVKEAGILAFPRLWGSVFQDLALAQIQQLTQDDFWRNRWRATIALQGCIDPKAKALLLQMQQDEHFRVVAAALEILSHGAAPPPQI